MLRFVNTSGVVPFQNGDTVILFGNGLTADIDGEVSPLTSGLTFIYGRGNTLFEAETANQNIVDFGQGTKIELQSPTGVTDIFGFQFDPTASLTMEWIRPQAQLAAATLRPDGHGGTMIGRGSWAVDFIRDAHVAPSQIHGTDPL